MEPTDPSSGSQDTATEIMVGLDVVSILTSRFAREMGRQFDRHWQESLSATREPTRRLFSGIQPGEENRTINAHIVQARLEDGGEESSASPAVRSAFIDVVESLLDSVRRVLGPRLVQEASGEAIRVLSMVEKYEGSGAAARAFISILTEAADPKAG
jgi:hypothetical protein